MGVGELGNEELGSNNGVDNFQAVHVLGVQWSTLDPMQTVVETPSYLKAAEMFTTAEREQIVSMLAADPECGNLMQGTGGFRKVRVGREGMGKRGGARVIYIYRNDSYPVFLITAYAKNDKGNLSRAERNVLAKRADEIFSRYGV